MNKLGLRELILKEAEYKYLPFEYQGMKVFFQMPSVGTIGKFMSFAKSVFKDKDKEGYNRAEAVYKGIIPFVIHFLYNEDKETRVFKPEDAPALMNLNIEHSFVTFITNVLFPIFANHEVAEAMVKTEESEEEEKKRHEKKKEG